MRFVATGSPRLFGAEVEVVNVDIGDLLGDDAIL